MRLFASCPVEEDWARFVSLNPFMLAAYLYHWVMGELEGEGEGEGELEGEGGACTDRMSIIISALFNTFQHCKQWHYFAKCHYHEMVNFGEPIIALVIWWETIWTNFFPNIHCSDCTNSWSFSSFLVSSCLFKSWSIGQRLYSFLTSDSFYRYFKLLVAMWLSRDSRYLTYSVTYPRRGYSPWGSILSSIGNITSVRWRR